MTFKKVVKDGKVAVLYSPGFGAGWYSWNASHPEILFDPNIVKFVEKEEWDKCRAYVELKYPDIYYGGLEDLEVVWLKEGTQFIINEYDGNESIQINESTDWLIA
jgi:hypothetical protein